MVEDEIEQRSNLRVYMHVRQRPRIPLKLQIRLLQMIEVEMRITEGMDEIARLETGDLRHHHGQ